MAQDTLQAKRFAQAIFQIAQEKNELEKWGSDLEEISMIADSPEIIAVLDSPKYPFNKKAILLLNKLPDTNKLVMNMVMLLVSQNNLRLISSIALEYVSLLNDYQGIEKAEVVTAASIDSEQQKIIINNLENLTGKKIILDIKVDPAIIGGLIIRVGGKIIDGSTISRLNSLKNNLMGLSG